MSLYSPEEIAELKSNPKTAALGEKLEKEIFIPKERLDEVLNKTKNLEEELKKFNDEKAKLAEDAKKAAELKAIEDGKSKELLTQKDAELEKARKEKEELQKVADAYKEQQKKIREGAIARIKDEDLKKIAEKLQDVQDVVDFVEKLEKNKVIPFSGKSKSVNAEDGKPAFKDLREAEAYYREKGLAQ